MEDTRLAIDSKTSFLEHDSARDLVAQVQNYRGTKLWLFVMKGSVRFGRRRLLRPAGGTYSACNKCSNAN